MYYAVCGVATCGGHSYFDTISKSVALLLVSIHLASYLTRRTFLAFHGKYLGTTRAREQQARIQTRVTGLRKAVRFPEQRISYYYAYIATPRPPLLGAFSATNRSLPSLHPHLRTPMLKAPQALFIITRITHVLHTYYTRITQIYHAPYPWITQRFFYFQPHSSHAYHTTSPY